MAAERLVRSQRSAFARGSGATVSALPPAASEDWQGETLSSRTADLNYPLQIGDRQSKIDNSLGVLAQLVERLNGIEEVRGSNPLGSTPSFRRLAARRAGTIVVR